MPGRLYSAGDGYRYGFNGKENDNDVKGEANQQDYGMRIYDPRLVRFLSIDPLTEDYPELTPYQFASNSPIAGIDLDGGELKLSIGLQNITSNMLATSSQDAYEAAKNGKNPNSAFVLGGLKHIGAGVAGGAIAADWLTGANVTRTVLALYTASEFFAAFEHTRAPTTEGRAEQDRRSKEHLTNAFMAWGGDKILGKILPPVAKYMSGRFIIGTKTLKKVTEHLKQFGNHAENTVMLEDLKKIVNGEMKATEIHINFARHELREGELMKNGMSPEKAHEAVLKEQGMYHKEYDKKLYTEKALKAGNAQMEKEAINK